MPSVAWLVGDHLHLQRLSFSNKLQRKANKVGRGEKMEGLKSTGGREGFPEAIMAARTKAADPCSLVDCPCLGETGD